MCGLPGPEPPQQGDRHSRHEAAVVFCRFASSYIARPPGQRVTIEPAILIAAASSYGAKEAQK
jgi:hypothetical protein